ncbi:hypothetical protein FDUTEX481_07722 [Tolypothrix sp. PCC 7601]|nr:hypothetical protein FDUTEX481_07722 [Tolypothrix sp. PCC 7601]
MLGGFNLIFYKSNQPAGKVLLNLFFICIVAIFKICYLSISVFLIV